MQRTPSGNAPTHVAVFDACISATCLGVDDPSVGLAATANEGAFKCYMADTGLLVSQLFSDSSETPHEVYRDILLGKLEINEGMFTENVVAQQLVANGTSCISTQGATARTAPIPWRSTSL